MKPTRLPTPKNCLPCDRCGEMPEASQDDLGFNVYHFCGDRMSMAVNWQTIEYAVNEWNKLSQPA